MSDFGIGNLVSSPLSFMSSILGMGMQQYNIDKQLDWQQKNIDITREREDNAIQRQIADMKLAGINPLMAVTHGAIGASSAPMVGTPTGNITAPTLDVGGLLAGSKQQFEKPKQDAEIAKLASDTDINIEKISNLIVERELASAQTEVEKQTILNQKAEIEKMAKQVELMTAQIESEKTKQMLNKATARLSYNELKIALAKINFLNSVSEEKKSNKKWIEAQIKDIQAEKVRRWVNDIWRNTNHSLGVALGALDTATNMFNMVMD